ncbi:uncharacterized protein LOC62_07G009049 [Vanrija pseudolonga]|uniref:GATA-type domain-containing protein n=1 Tax=Vanrija pseudolonga TaxID=143232 RepID=A0AAF0YJ98_9TREE|nr:hypothetical protein LOC62_07G009049 [Vanrija pseudolonga]
MDGSNQPPSWGLMPHPTDTLEDQLNEMMIDYAAANNIILSPTGPVEAPYYTTTRSPASERSPSPDFDPSSLFLPDLATPALPEFPYQQNEQHALPVPQQPIFNGLTDGQVYHLSVAEVANPATAPALPDWTPYTNMFQRYPDLQPTEDTRGGHPTHAHGHETGESAPNTTTQAGGSDANSHPRSAYQESAFRNMPPQVNGVVYEYAHGSFAPQAPTITAPAVAAAPAPAPAPAPARAPSPTVAQPPVRHALPPSPQAINHNHYTYTQANNSSYLHLRVTDPSSNSNSVYARRTAYSYATLDFPQPRAAAGAGAAAPYQPAPAVRAMPAQPVAYRPAPTVGPAMPVQQQQAAYHPAPEAVQPQPQPVAYNYGPAGGQGYLPPDLLRNQPRVPALGEAGGSNYAERYGPAGAAPALGAPAPIRPNQTFNPLADDDDAYYPDAYRFDDASSAGSSSTPRPRGRPPRARKDGDPEDYSAWVDHGAVPPPPIAQNGPPHKLNHVCFNCGYVGVSTWRRSLRYLGKMVCNRCGCFEKEKGVDRHWHKVKDAFPYTHAAERRRRRDTGVELPDGTPEPKWVRPVTAGPAGSARTSARASASASASSASPARRSTRSTPSARESPLPTTPGAGPSTPGGGPVRHTRQQRSVSPYAAPPAPPATPGTKRSPGRPRKN